MLFAAVLLASAVACSVNEVPPTTPVDGGSDARVDATVDASSPDAPDAVTASPCRFDDDASRFGNCVFQ